MNEQAQEDQSGADIALESPVGKINVKNVKSVNTLLTLVAAVAACFAVYLLMQHQVEAKEGMAMFVSAVKEQTTAVKEQTFAQREQNCLIAMAQEKREQSAELCKRLSR